MSAGMWFQGKKSAPMNQASRMGSCLSYLVWAAVVGAWLLGCAEKPPIREVIVETHAPGKSEVNATSQSGVVSASDSGKAASSSSQKDTVAAIDSTDSATPSKPASEKVGKTSQSENEKPVAKRKPGRGQTGPENTEPLIMENADRLEGFRTRGEYILTGNVRFSHGALHFETQRAVWSKELNLVYCEQGMRLTHHGSELVSDRGNYNKAKSEAEAEGHVIFRDSTGQIRGRGNRLNYNRLTHDVKLTGSPEIRRLYFDSLPGKKGGLDTTRPNDTLLLQALHMQYNDSTQIAFAESSVVITKRKTRITCDHAEYRDQVDSLLLVGNPLVKVERSRILGEKMRMKVTEEEIRGLLVQGKAQALNVDPRTDSTPERQSEIRGDSLQIAFTGRNIDSVQVFNDAEGLYFDTPRPLLRNRMQGREMLMRFKGKEVQSAKVKGGAKSTYYHLENGELRGRNVAQGDTIRFAFVGGQVDEVLVTGHAKGFYFGRNKPKPSDSTSTQVDSARVKADTLDHHPAVDTTGGKKAP